MITEIEIRQEVVSTLSLVGSDINFSAPVSLVLDDQENMYVADAGSSSIFRIAPSGAFSKLGTNNTFRNPMGVGVDRMGNVYVADTLNHVIRKIDQYGEVSIFAGLVGSAGHVDSTDGSGSSARFNRPRGISVDVFGNVFVADTGNHIVRKITSAGEVSTFAGRAGVVGFSDGSATHAKFDNLYGLAVDLFGNVYVADTGNHVIRKITQFGDVSTVLNPLDVALRNPGDVAVDLFGNLYVADTYHHVIYKLEPEKEAWLVAGMKGIPGAADGVQSEARFSFPMGICTHPNGNLFVADFGNRAIRKIE